MTEERDRNIEALFAQANVELEGNDFVARIMAKADRSRRRRLAMILAACVVALPLLAFIASPLNAALQWFAAFIALPIATTGGAVTSVLLAPVNSVGSLLALILVFLWMTTRKASS